MRLMAALLVGVLLGDAGVLGGISPLGADDAATFPSTQRSAQLLDERSRSRVPTTPSNYTVGYYGDSFAFDAAEHAHHLLETGGRLQVVGASFHGVAVCDLLPQMRSDVASQDLFAAVMVFAGNAFTDCMKKPDGRQLSKRATLKKFETDLQAAVDMFVAEGTRVYLGTVPTSRLQESFGSDWSLATNRVVRRVAKRTARAKVIESAAVVLNADGDYTETLPCLDFEPCLNGKRNLIRESTGIHFCTSGYEDVAVAIDTCPVWSSGAFRFAAALTSPVVEDAQKYWRRQQDSTSN